MSQKPACKCKCDEPVLGQSQKQKLARKEKIYDPIFKNLKDGFKKSIEKDDIRFFREALVAFFVMLSATPMSRTAQLNENNIIPRWNSFWKGVLEDEYLADTTKTKFYKVLNEVLREYYTKAKQSDKDAMLIGRVAYHGEPIQAAKRMQRVFDPNIFRLPLMPKRTLLTKIKGKVLGKKVQTDKMRRALQQYLKNAPMSAQGQVASITRQASAVASNRLSTRLKSAVSNRKSTRLPSAVEPSAFAAATAALMSKKQPIKTDDKPRPKGVYKLTKVSVPEQITAIKQTFTPLNKDIFFFQDFLKKFEDIHNEKQMFKGQTAEDMRLAAKINLLAEREKRLKSIATFKTMLENYVKNTSKEEFHDKFLPNLSPSETNTLYKFLNDKLAAVQKTNYSTRLYQMPLPPTDATKHKNLVNAVVKAYEKWVSTDKDQRVMKELPEIQQEWGISNLQQLRKNRFGSEPTAPVVADVLHTGQTQKPNVDKISKIDLKGQGALKLAALFGKGGIPPPPPRRPPPPPQVA